MGNPFGAILSELPVVTVFPQIEARHLLAQLRQTPACIRGPACIQGRLVLVHPHCDELMVILCVFHRNNKHVC